MYESYIKCTVTPPKHLLLTLHSCVYKVGMHKIGQTDVVMTQTLLILAIHLSSTNNRGMPEIGQRSLYASSKLKVF